MRKLEMNNSVETMKVIALYNRIMDTISHNQQKLCARHDDLSSNYFVELLDV